MTEFPLTLAICSIGCLILAGVLAWQKGAAPAAVMGTLFVAAAALSYMPQLDTFKAFSVEVRLRGTLDRADEIIKRLRQLSIVNGRIAYRAEAINLFFDTDSNAIQRDLDAVDEELTGAGATPEEMAAMREVYIKTIGYRLRALIYQIGVNAFSGKETGAYYNSLAVGTPERTRAANFPSQFPAPDSQFRDFDDWKRQLELMYIGVLMPEQHRAGFRNFWNKVEASYATSVRDGRAEASIEPLIKLTTNPAIGPETDTLWEGRSLP